MGQTDGLPGDRWHNIRIQVSSRGIGTGETVQCAECGREIETESRTKAYIIGSRSQWKLSRVYHPDCSDLMTVEAIGDHSEQEGIVFGTARYAPAIARQSADDRDVSEAEMRAIFGDDLSVIDSPLPRHHLTDLELGAVYIPGDGRFESINRSETA